MESREIIAKFAYCFAKGPSVCMAFAAQSTSLLCSPFGDEAYIGFFIQGKSFGLFKNPANG
jgi:hypothetical protein